MKKIIIDEYKKIKANLPKKGIRVIANELYVHKNCLLECIHG